MEKSKSKKNLLKKIFSINKNKTHIDGQKTDNDPNTVKANSAFEYIQTNYGFDCNIYRQLSSIIYDHSVAAANEFAELLEKKSNEDLVHFFFDFFISFYVIVKSKNFHPNNKDANSAIIDGMHIEYFSNVSNVVIDSILQLWSSQNKCFLKTCFKTFKNKDVGARINFMITIASFCAGKTEIGATETLSLLEPFKYIQNSKLSSIDTMFQIVKRH